jgi:hypothetical protein
MPRDRVELLAEFRQRQILRRQRRGLGTAQAGRFAEAELLRADPGQRGQAVSQSIEPRELGLHLAQFHGHRVEVLLHELARALGFALLG